MGFGAVLGQLVEMHFFANSYRLNCSLWIWHQTSIIKTGVRIVLTVGVAAVFPAFGLFIEADLTTTFSFITHFFLCCCMLPFLTGFTVFAFLRLLFHMCKLDNEEALGKEFEPRTAFQTLTREATTLI